MGSPTGSCLCGAVAWSVDGRPQFMSHCHCSRCRKAHGAAFATFVMAPEDDFHLLRGREAIVSYLSSDSFTRPFCRHCGSTVPDGIPTNGLVGVPAGPFDVDPGVRPLAHIFVGSKAPWFEITDALPRFPAYPPGVDMPVLPDPPAPARTGSGLRASCLCGQVRFVVTGTPRWFRFCHCSRCRKARAAAFASNLVTYADGVTFTQGADAIIVYRLPGARFFGQTFCRTCGSPAPRIDRDRDYGIVPAGALDDDPGIRPVEHIFVGSKAPWHEITDVLPRYTEQAPPVK